MKNSLKLFGVLATAAFIFLTCTTKQSNDLPLDDNAEQDLRTANAEFYAALNAMFIGEMELMNNIWSHGKDVTLMGPFGDCLVGWEAVSAEFQNEANMKLGGKVDSKDLLVVAGNNMGYTLCNEQGQNMTADGKPVLVSFRATNVFRRENGQFKLVHHHTDISIPLQEAIDTQNE